MGEKYTKPAREANSSRPAPEIRRDVKLHHSLPHWSEVDAEELQHFINLVIDGGACVILSRSSDGGVLSTTVVFGNERIRAYSRSADEAIRQFTDIISELGL